MNRYARLYRQKSKTEYKKIINLFTNNSDTTVKTEVLSGLTVALALVPEAIAFALIAGLSPLTGLYAAFVMGLVTSIFGGRPGMISGATGAVAVVIVALAISHGPEYVFATVVLAGIIQILAGVFKLGKLMRWVPLTVIFCFVKCVAVIVFLFVFVLFTILFIWCLPQLSLAIPASLVGILVVFGILSGFGIDTKTVADIAPIQGGFPPFHIPNVPYTFETLALIFPSAA